MVKKNKIIEEEKYYNEIYKEFVELYFSLLGIKNGKFLELYPITVILNKELELRKFIYVQGNKVTDRLSFGDKDMFFNCETNDYEESKLRNTLFFDKESFMFHNYRMLINEEIDFVKFRYFEKLSMAFNSRFWGFIEFFIIELVKYYIESEEYIFSRAIDCVNSLSEEELEQAYMIYEMKYGE